MRAYYSLLGFGARSPCCGYVVLQERIPGAVAVAAVRCRGGGAGAERAAAGVHGPGADVRLHHGTLSVPTTASALAVRLCAMTLSPLQTFLSLWLADVLGERLAMSAVSPSRPSDVRMALPLSRTRAPPPPQDPPIDYLYSKNPTYVRVETAPVARSLESAPPPGGAVRRLRIAQFRVRAPPPRGAHEVGRRAHLELGQQALRGGLTQHRS